MIGIALQATTDSWSESAVNRENMQAQPVRVKFPDDRFFRPAHPPLTHPPKPTHHPQPNSMSAIMQPRCQPCQEAIPDSRGNSSMVAVQPSDHCGPVPKSASPLPCLAPRSLAADRRRLPPRVGDQACTAVGSASLQVSKRPRVHWANGSSTAQRDSPRIGTKAPRRRGETGTLVPRFLFDLAAR